MLVAVVGVCIFFSSTCLRQKCGARQNLHQVQPNTQGGIKLVLYSGLSALGGLHLFSHVFFDCDKFICPLQKCLDLPHLNGILKAFGGSFVIRADRRRRETKINGIVALFYCRQSLFLSALCTRFQISFWAQ